MKHVKLLLLAFLTITFTVGLQAQKKSPAAVAKGTINGADITINYCSPAVKGRKLYGGLIPSGKVWRTGANEATTIEVNKDIMIEGKSLAAGKYAIFTIGAADGWTIIFNKDANQWGAYSYDNSKDALRIDVKAEKTEAFAERMDFKVGEDKVHLMWGDIEVAFAVK